MDIIQKYASALALELAEMKLFDQESVVRKLRTYIRMAIRDTNDEAMGVLNQKFIELVEKQQSLRLNSPEYIQTGFEIAKLKPMRAAANRIASSSKREDKLAEAEEKLAWRARCEDFWKDTVKELDPEAYQRAINRLIAEPIK